MLFSLPCFSYVYLLVGKLEKLCLSFHEILGMGRLWNRYCCLNFGGDPEHAIYIYKIVVFIGSPVVSQLI